MYLIYASTDYGLLTPHIGVSPLLDVSISIPTMSKLKNYVSCSGWQQKRTDWLNFLMNEKKYLKLRFHFSGNELK